MEHQRHLHSDAVITGSRDSRKGTTLHGEIGPTRRKIPRRIAEQAFNFFIGASEEHYRQKGNEIRKQKFIRSGAVGCQKKPLQCGSSSITICCRPGQNLY